MEYIQPPTLVEDPLDGNEEPKVVQMTVKPFTIWSPRQFIEWPEPPGLHLLLPAYVTCGELTAIVGQGGLGKSRLALWLAVSQIVRRTWCGLPTGGDPAHWLILGNENGLSRGKTDFGAIFDTLSPEEQQAVEEHLLMQAVVTLDDGFVDLGDQSTRDRLAETVKQAKPGAVVVDPLANFIPGDLNKPSDMRDGIRTLCRTIREHAPQAAIIALHHARTGRQNIAQGVGYDAANFALGAKTLFNACRAVINLMPGAEDDDTKLVLSCAKASNCRRFDPVGLRFNPRTFTYDADPGFDLDRWRDDVDGKRSGSSCGIADIVNAVRNGVRKAGDIAETVSETTGVKRRTVEKYLRIAVQKRYLDSPFRGQYILGPKSNTI